MMYTPCEALVAEVMRRLGFREPENHPDWHGIANSARTEFAASVLEVLEDAGQSMPMTFRQAMEYDLYSSRLMKIAATLNIGCEFVAKMIARRAERKLAKYIEAIDALSERKSTSKRTEA